MDLDSLLNQIENDEITFHDKLTLAFLVMGAIFLGIILVSVALNILHFQQIEFESPFL